MPTSKAFQTGHLMGWDLEHGFSKMDRTTKRATLARLVRMDEAAHNDLVKGIWHGLAVHDDALYTIGRRSRLAQVAERLI